MRKRISPEAPEWFKEILASVEGKIPSPPPERESDEISQSEIAHCLQLNTAVRESEHPFLKGIRKGLASLGYSPAEVVFGPMIGDTESEYGVALVNSGVVFEFIYSFPGNVPEKGFFEQWKQVQGAGSSGEWEQDLRVIALCKKQLSA
jgi:hypothetical protein